jgi:hypothetical protein
VFGGGNKKKLANKTDKVDVTPKNTVKQMEQPKVSAPNKSNGRFETKMSYQYTPKL